MIDSNVYNVRSWLALLWWNRYRKFMSFYHVTHHYFLCTSFINIHIGTSSGFCDKFEMEMKKLIRLAHHFIAWNNRILTKREIYCYAINNFESSLSQMLLYSIMLIYFDSDLELKIKPWFKYITVFYCRSSSRHFKLFCFVAPSYTKSKITLTPPTFFFPYPNIVKMKLST